MTRVRLIIAFVMLAATSLLAATFAQDTERSRLLTYVENQLSAPNRQIRLNGLAGALSSDVSLDSITIADEDGVWMTIVKPRLVWTRSALLLGRLDVESLTAERIDYPRPPGVDASLPAPEATPLSLPEFPVAVIVRKLTVPEVAIGQPVFGLASRVSVDGRITLDEGSLDLNLLVDRLDGPGGQLQLEAVYDGTEKKLKLDARLSEPENGIVANLLGLEGKPPVALSVTGEAPIDDLTVDIALDVAERSILRGALQLKGQADGLLAAMDLGGPLSQILPARHRPFFGPETRLAGQAFFAQAGGMELRTLRLEGGALDLDAQARIGANGLVEQLMADLTLSPDDTGRIVLPTPGSEAAIRDGRMEIRFDAAQSADWRAELAVSDFQSENLAAGSLSVAMTGMTSAVDAAGRRATTFSLTGALDEISTTDPSLARALGQTLNLEGSGTWAGDGPLELQRLALTGANFALITSGTVTGATFDGAMTLEAQRLAAFSGLAGRKLGGGLNLEVKGQVMPFSGRFDLDLTGTGQDLAVGEPLIDPVLSGRTTLAGAVARSENGLSFRRLSVAGTALDATVDGGFSSTSADLRAQAEVANLSAITPDASGPVRFDLSITGASQPFNVTATLALASGRLLDREVRDLVLRLTGTTGGDDFTGDVNVSGILGGGDVMLDARVAAADGAYDLSGLRMQIGATRMSGDLRRSGDGLFDADLRLASDDISDLAALALVRAQGAVTGHVRLQADAQGKQSGETNLSIQGLRYEGVRVDRADLEGRFADLFGQPVLDAQIDGSRILLAGVDMSRLTATARTEGTRTDFSARAEFSREQANLNTSGSITRSDLASTLTVSKFDLTSRLGDARLTAPAQIFLEDGVYRIERAELAVGEGAVRVTGGAGERLDLDVTVDRLPLNLANAIRPDLAMDGVVSGRAQIRGQAAEPDITFEINGTDLTAAPLAANGLQPVSVKARGRMSDGRILLEEARLTSPQDIDLTAVGTIPVSASGLDLRIVGGASLAIAQPLLVDRGTRLTGYATIEARVRGSLENPDATGQLSVAGGTLTDPGANLQLTQISLQARLTGNQVVITGGSANIATGGSMTVTGSVNLAAPMAADVDIRLNGVRYTDGQTFFALMDGALTLTGDLTAGPTLGGTLTLNRTEITVPESFASSVTLPVVRHVRPDRGVRVTLSRLRRATPNTSRNRTGGDLRFDLTVNAPRRIFVRGRGLDAELGGTIYLTGSLSDLMPQGSFSLIRGRLIILSRRIELERANITLDGNLDPILEVRATSRAGDIDAIILMTGRASDPEVLFTSNPELPEDEVLAQLIFGRSIDELSAVQILRLAAIAAELAGGGSAGLVGGLRSGLGLDDLDLVTDNEGGTAVRVGKYINDRIYLGVQAGSSSEATINLDLTKELKARGSYSTDGNSSLGLYFERDY